MGRKGNPQYRKKTSRAKNFLGCQTFGKTKGDALPLAASKTHRFSNHYRLLPMDTKVLIQDLISAGKTEEALDLLGQITTDAVLLQSRYNGTKRQYNMGIIDFSEWSRTQAQINFSILEMVKGSNSANPAPAPARTAAQIVTNEGEKVMSKVFVSYSWDDKPVVKMVKAYLEEHGCKVTIDDDHLDAGDSIAGFIQDSIRDNHFILSIVSKNSLSSGWVGRESTASFFAEWLANKQFIPARLDNAFNDPRFFVSTLRSIEEKITDLDGLITETQLMRADTGPLDMDRKKLLDLKSKLPDILTRLKSVNTVPIDGDNFPEGMKKILERIRRT